MEKLQPVIKQIFWILFGLALLLVLIGWWTAKGALSTQIAARKVEVDKAFSDAEQNVSTVPNKNWTDGAMAENDKHKRQFSQSAKGLRKDQLGARTYPAGIRDELTKLKYGSKIEKKTLREQFARLYLKYFHEQIMVIKPFINGEGLVDVSNAQITQENPSRWRTVRPTSPEIWHAQEDIWLLRSLLDSIAAVNAGAERIDKAPIRSLLMLQLRGGDREAPVGGSSGGGFAGGGFGGDSDYESSMSSDMGGGFGGRSDGGGGGGGSEAWKSFEGSLAGDLLSEEFGSAGGSGGGSGESGFSTSSDYDQGDYDDGDYDEGDSSGSGSTGAAGATKRYVDDGDLYRSRAFQLEVKILQQEIPSLLAELTNSSFPVEIVRVDASFGSASAGILSGMGGGGGGGYESEDGDYDDGGGEMSSGFGGGFGGGIAGGGRGGGMGSTGMGSGGMGSGGMGSAGMGGGGLGGGGFGGGIAGLGAGLNRTGNAPGSRALAKKNAIGARLLAAAMADPNIANVRVAGLMTMYISQEENEAQEGAEAAAETESQEEGGVDLPLDETLIDAVEQDTETDGGDSAVPDENPENGSEATEASSAPLDEPNSTDSSAGGPPAPNDTSQPPAAAVPPTG
ncbi:MAG: hypothetical protein GY903_06820 [Fuerstiella sp.]|nr:hypothetical protein [Fuerstiella sp.]MCP4854188.1 hypothetical protein [Fuerstiella sp.]